MSAKRLAASVPAWHQLQIAADGDYPVRLNAIITNPNCLEVRKRKDLRNPGTIPVPCWRCCVAVVAVTEHIQ
jgi:hypothetical protein